MVVSSERYNARQPDVILMPITSQLRSEARPDDIVVANWQEAGLLKPSAIKPVIATIEQALVLRRLGALGEADRENLKAALVDLMGA